MVAATAAPGKNIGAYGHAVTRPYRSPVGKNYRVGTEIARLVADASQSHRVNTLNLLKFLLASELLRNRREDSVCH